MRWWYDMWRAERTNWRRWWLAIAIGMVGSATIGALVSDLPILFPVLIGFVWAWTVLAVLNPWRQVTPVRRQWTEDDL